MYYAVVSSIVRNDLDELRGHWEYGLEIDVNEADAEEDTLLMLAVRYGDCAMVEFLLEKGADPNAEFNDGMTALYTAISMRSLEKVRALVAGGANVNPPNYGSGESPLYWATYCAPDAPVEEIADYLISCGAEIAVPG